MVRGFADIHNHQHANLGFGGKAFWGGAFGPMAQAVPECRPRCTGQTGSATHWVPW